MAAIANDRDDTRGQLTTTGTQPAYSITTNSANTVLQRGLKVMAKVHAVPTGACTLNVDGTGARKWYDGNLVQLGSGSLTLGEMVGSVYDNTLDSGVGGWIRVTNPGASIFARGMILMWSGSASSPPTGWALCDGGTYAKSDGSGNVTVPDLRNVFIKGATTAGSGAGSVGFTAGSATHSHTVTVAGTALTTAQLPAHNHGINDPGHTHGVSDPGHAHTYNNLAGGAGISSGGAAIGQVSSATSTATTGISINGAVTGITTQNAGSGATHTHTATTDSPNSEPPYYTLAYIYKL
jgi:hypothetical protein